MLATATGGGETMTRAKADVTQSELKGYLKALREAGPEDWRIEVAKPDGSTVKIIAGKSGEAADDGDEIDRMIDRAPGS